MAPYRPPGRSNRSGRGNADNDILEGLPVKQWSQTYSKVSLAPAVSEVETGKDDKWGEPPMPRDCQMLSSWTQYLLRAARSGKVGNKRKQDAEVDEDKPEDEAPEEETKQSSTDERAYVAKKWKPLPEHSLEPEHKHFNFLAKRRRGLPNLYGPDQQAVVVPMRKTKVQKADQNGEVAVYEVLVPEGQTIEGEIAESTELADVKPVTAAPGTVIEGVGVANEDGVMVAEHLKPSIAPRRNRPPPKKKGGPGRGKKRVTFTNPDGTTYTKIVPNATKIVPQPGQTIKHVAKGEEATADVSTEEAAKVSQQQQEGQGDEGEGEGEGEGDEGSGDEDDDEGDEDDDDREDGELSDEDAPATGTQTPAKPEQNDLPMEDVQPTSQSAPIEEVAPIPELTTTTVPETTESKPTEDETAAKVSVVRSTESSPEMPLAQSHSRNASLAEPGPLSLDTAMEDEKVEEEKMPECEEPSKPAELEKEEEASAAPAAETAAADDGDDDLLGNLEKSIG